MPSTRFYLPSGGSQSDELAHHTSYGNTNTDHSKLLVAPQNGIHHEATANGLSPGRRDIFGSMISINEVP